MGSHSYLGGSHVKESGQVLNRRSYLVRAFVLLLSLSLFGGIVASAEDPLPTDPGPVEPGPTDPDQTDPDQKAQDPTEPDLVEADPSGALEELLRTVETAEGVSEKSKRQLQDRLIRLSERMERFGPGIDQEEAIVAELEALRDDDAELTSLIEAILAAYEAGHEFDEIVSILVDADPDVEPDDPALARVAEIAREAELAEEENDAILAALQTEVEPSGELNRGQLVSTMAHIRNLERKAQRDGVELTEEQLTELVREGLSGHLTDDEIKGITETALNSDRGMSEAVRHIKNAVPPNGKGRKDSSEPEPSEDTQPPSEEEVPSPEIPDGDDEDNAVIGTASAKGNGNGNGHGRAAAAASKGKNK